MLRNMSTMSLISHGAIKVNNISAKDKANQMTLDSFVFLATLRANMQLYKLN